MKTIYLFFITFLLVLPNFVNAQLEKVIVETFYVSDANDSIDTLGDGNGLPIGSKTYRVYVDLQAGSKLLKLYGSSGHALKFSSTANFYNNKDRGSSTAYNIGAGGLKENTVALDTWITLGQAARGPSGKRIYGLPKPQDNDVPNLLTPNQDGMLQNNDISAGLALTSSDGLFTLSGSATAPLANGDFFDLNTIKDSTIFSKNKTGNVFNSNFCRLEDTSGIIGAKPDSNQILVAQLTTLGDLSFELNIDIKLLDGSIKRYVASETKPVSGDTIVSAILKYPAVCGCKDVNYLEYSNTFSCSLPSACKTPIVLGCMDVSACNFNPNANFPVNTMCCYVGYCNDRDITVVCPAISNARIARPDFILFPSKVENELNIEFEARDDDAMVYEIFNVYGVKLMQNKLAVNAGLNQVKLDVSALDKGMYLFKLNRNGTANTKIFIKE